MSAYNILSYFIKDITKINEKMQYRISKDFYEDITIYYKDRLLYSYMISFNAINNVLTNVYKQHYTISTNTIIKNKLRVFKTLFYNKDNDNLHLNNNRIIYFYKVLKYMQKHTLIYFYSIKIDIKYYNMYKYICKYKHENYKAPNTFKSMILIIHKYELNYINTFFRMYLDYI
jgi:hypothetical protein